LSSRQKEALRRTPGPTLRDRINRVAYVVINVSDLERSRAFYESVSPLRVVSRTRAPSQRFAGLGIERGEFDGYLMDDGRGGRPTQIHLIEWMTPKPIGRHYSCFWHVGLAKIAITTPSARAKLRQLNRLSIRPSNDRIYRGYTSITDPDGVIISFPGSHTLDLPEEDDPCRHERLQHTNPSVTDIGRSMRFYGEVLGLDLDRESVPCEPILSSQGPGSDLSHWDSHLYTARGDGRFRVDLSQFHHPPPSAESVVPFAEPSHVGIARIGFEVDDVDACFDILRTVEPIGDGPGSLLAPEDWDYGPEVGKRRVLCFRDPDGIRLELVEKVPCAPMSGCEQPDNPPPIELD
jgi:catechol 2,3-dioxygenase-like lactoylglutathione lyase family enzyme